MRGLDVDAQEATESFTLGPGDVLYLPHGWPHAARAFGGPSMHLTFTLAEPALFSMFLSSGARAEEMLGLTVADIHPGEGRIYVRTKGLGGAKEACPAAPEAFAWLALYLAELADEGHRSEPDEPLWWTRRHPPRPLTLRSLPHAPHVTEANTPPSGDRTQHPRAPRRSTPHAMARRSLSPERKPPPHCQQETTGRTAQSSRRSRRRRHPGSELTLGTGGLDLNMNPNSGPDDRPLCPQTRSIHEALTSAGPAWACQRSVKTSHNRPSPVLGPGVAVRVRLTG